MILSKTNTISGCIRVIILQKNRGVYDEAYNVIFVPLAVKKEKKRVVDSLSYQDLQKQYHALEIKYNELQKKIEAHASDELDNAKSSRSDDNEI